MYKIRENQQGMLQHPGLTIVGKWGAFTTHRPAGQAVTGTLYPCCCWGELPTAHVAFVRETLPLPTMPWQRQSEGTKILNLSPPVFSPASYWQDWTKAGGQAI